MSSAEAMAVNVDRRGDRPQVHNSPANHGNLARPFRQIVRWEAKVREHVDRLLKFLIGEVDRRPNEWTLKSSCRPLFVAEPVLYGRNSADFGCSLAPSIIFDAVARR